MIPDARLVDERLANLLSHARHKVERNTGFSDALSKLELEFWTDQVAAYTELQQLRATQRGREWVAWKAGDPLPPDGDYWCTSNLSEHPEDTIRFDLRPRAFAASCVIAYWPVPLPPPYQGAK